MLVVRSLRVALKVAMVSAVALPVSLSSIASAEDTQLFPETRVSVSKSNSGKDGTAENDFGKNGWPTDTRSDLKRAGGDWFPKNSVTDLNDNPDLQQQADLKFFLDKRDYTQPANPQQQGQAATAAMPNTPQSVVERFGNPDEDPALEPQADSPKPLQAVMLALNSGDSELAYRYARQYVRRLRNLQAQSDRVVSLIGVAREREGMMDEQSAKAWASSEEDRALLAADREREKALQAEKDGLAALDDRARALIALAQQSEDIGNLDTVKASTPNKINPDAETAQAQAQALRAKFQGKITPDPAGRVMVFLFMRSRDKVSAETARNMEKVFRQYAEDNRVMFSGLLLGDENPEAVRTFRRYTKASFEIKPGADLAKAMGVTNAPTVAFVVPSTGKATIINGGLSQAQFSEMMLIMQGH